MKPSIIAANQAAINSFKYSILSEYCKFASTISTILDASTDSRKNQMYIQQLQLVCAWVNIVLDYFTPTVEADENFMTFAEFKDIIRHLNRVFGTEIWIEL